MASTGFSAAVLAESRTAMVVGISPYSAARMVCAVGLARNLMKVRSAATFLLCGLMYMFQPPMLEYPGVGEPANVGIGSTPTWLAVSLPPAAGLMEAS